MFLCDLHEKHFNKSRNPDDWARFKKLRNEINSILMKKNISQKSCKRTVVTLTGLREFLTWPWEKNLKQLLLTQ